MKKLLSFTLVLLMCLTLLPIFGLNTSAADEHYLEINEMMFPDDNFRRWVIENLSVSGDGEGGYYMTQAQADSVTVINCSQNNIQSLSGIEYFTALEYLYCDANHLTSLDLAGNTSLIQLDCARNNLNALNIRNNTALEDLWCENNSFTEIDVSRNTALTTLWCASNQLTSLNVRSLPLLKELECSTNQLEELDVSSCPNLESLSCENNRIETLDVSKNTALKHLVCFNNQLTALDLSMNTALEGLNCGNNHLSTLNVSKLTELESFSADGQTIEDQTGLNKSGVYTFDMTKIMPTECLKNVTVPDASITLDEYIGVLTLPSALPSFTYRYDAETDPSGDDTELPDLPVGCMKTAESSSYEMEVQVFLTYEEAILPAFDGTIEWDPNFVMFKGKTPYVIYDGTPFTPRFTVKDKNGKIVDPSNYTYKYRENTNAGTGYVIVTFKDQYKGTAQQFFKIYLPATTATSVANTKEGIKITWAAVEGAAGYVIYRRAWNLIDAGWTDFVRWNNTTALNWTDTKIYAGTRYQYGIKAYFAKRVDPVSGAEIGGNVGDNFNLGIVGPLKTTVRITTRKLSSVTPGSKKLTAKWTGSSVFTGYQVQVASDSKFTKDLQTFKITDPKTVQKVVTGLTTNKTYYVRVRSYHLFEGMTYYGGWSNVINCKVK